jgi:hypothetical protein
VVEKNIALRLPCTCMKAPHELASTLIASATLLSSIPARDTERSLPISVSPQHHIVNGCRETVRSSIELQSRSPAVR